MKNPNTFIAIDPGKGGGIVLLSGGTVIISKMKDVSEFSNWLKEIKTQYENIIVFIEKVGRFRGEQDAGGKSFGIDKMLQNLAELMTVIKIEQLRYVEVPAITWQTSLKLKWKPTPEKQERKRRYKKFAEHHFPNRKITLATADAICIVLFAKMKSETDIQYIRDKMVNPNPEKLFSK